MPKPLDLKRGFYRSAIDLFTVNNLRKIAKSLALPRIGEKDQLISVIYRHIKKKSVVKNLWNQLTEIEKYAVSEAYHAKDGKIYEDKFSAKYVTDFVLPNLDLYESIKETSNLIFFFSPENQIIEDIRDTIAELVLSPKKNIIETSDELPEYQEVILTRHYLNENSKEQYSIEIFNGEEAVNNDLFAVLGQVASGKINVSEKTRKPSERSMQLISDALVDKDFYSYTEPYQDLIKKLAVDWKPDYFRAFSWPLLLQNGELAKNSGAKLVLTKSGIKALNEPLQDTIKILLDKWINSSGFDEFSRIDLIKGQKAKNGRNMTYAIKRRQVILKALKKCPANKWISIGEFSRFMKAGDFYFSVCLDEWYLYVENREYGSLGHEGFGDWNILQERYIMAFFMEYLAALGILDIGFTYPSYSRFDFAEIWGTDDFEFLSQYDGLLYFRLNNLGAWCLGKKKNYEPREGTDRKKLQVLSNLEIIEKEPLVRSEIIFLEKLALKTQDFVWQIDRKIILDSMEKGITIDSIESFLLNKSQNELPEVLWALINDLKKNSESIKYFDQAFIFFVPDSQKALQIAHNKNFSPFCMLANENYLVVKNSDLTKFKSALKSLGYIIP